MKLSNLFLILALSFSLLGCDRHHYQKKTSQTVHVSKQHNESGDDFIYWYWFLYNNTYYYYSSPTLVTPSGYSSFNWQQAKVNPLSNVSEKDIQEVEQETVENEELGEPMDNAIEANENSMAESAGYDNSSSDNANSDAGESTSSSSDSGSSGGDSGGGDSGGGD